MSKLHIIEQYDNQTDDTYWYCKDCGIEFVISKAEE